MSRNKPQTIGVIIENQNVLYFSSIGIRRWQPDDLLHHENLPHSDERSFVCRMARNQARLAVSDGPNEWRWKRPCPIAKAFPFHITRYDDL
jgi:hypothetical protein